MARATQGVIGMKFRPNDELLAMDVVRDDAFLVTVTDGGYAKRTAVTEWTPKGRGILGVKAMQLANPERGSLVGAIIAAEDEGSRHVEQRIQGVEDVGHGVHVRQEVAGDDDGVRPQLAQ